MSVTNTWKVETEESGVQGEHGLHETLPHKATPKRLLEAKCGDRVHWGSWGKSAVDLTLAWTMSSKPAQDPVSKT